MARYYFHLRDGEDILLDPEGRELDAGDVRKCALEEARAIIADEARSGLIALDQRLDVENGSGEIVLSLQFADAVVIKLRIGPDAADG